MKTTSSSKRAPYALLLISLFLGLVYDVLVYVFLIGSDPEAAFTISMATILPLLMFLFAVCFNKLRMGYTIVVILFGLQGFSVLLSLGRTVALLASTPVEELVLPFSSILSMVEVALIFLVSLTVFLRACKTLANGRVTRRLFFLRVFLLLLIVWTVVSMFFDLTGMQLNFYPTFEVVYESSILDFSLENSVLYFLSVLSTLSLYVALLFVLPAAFERYSAAVSPTEALRFLRMDHTAGKLSDEEYEEQKYELLKALR